MAEVSTIAGATSAHPARMSMHIEAHDVRYSCAGACGPELSAEEAIETVYNEVCSVFGAGRALVESRVQTQEVVSVRHAIILVLRGQNKSFPVIGRIIRRDHTTAMSGYKRGCSLYLAERDPAFRNKIKMVAARLEAKAGHFAGLQGRLKTCIAEFEARR